MREELFLAQWLLSILGNKSAELWIDPEPSCSQVLWAIDWGTELILHHTTTTFDAVRKNRFENIVGKGVIASNQDVLIFFCYPVKWTLSQISHFRLFRKQMKERYVSWNVCEKNFLTKERTFGEKEKLLIMRNFFFSQNVFKGFPNLRRQNAYVCFVFFKCLRFRQGKILSSDKRLNGRGTSYHVPSVYVRMQSVFTVRKNTVNIVHGLYEPKNK